MPGQQINGTNFIQVADFIKHKWGQDGWDRFNKNHQEQCRIFFEERMYPFEEYIKYLQTIQEEFKDEEVAYKIGWHRARHLLLGKGKRRTGWEMLSIVAVALHKFNNFGRVEVGRPEEKTIVVRMSELESHPLYCQRMKGFFASLASEGKKGKCEIVQESCVCRGDPACVFHINMLH